MSDQAALRRVLGAHLDRVFSPVTDEIVAELDAHRPAILAKLPDPRWDALGCPANDAATFTSDWLGYTLWGERLVLNGPIRIGELADGPITDIERRRDRDEAIAETVGHRLSAGLRRRPWTGLRPPEVCAIRLVASEGQHQMFISTFFEALREPQPGAEHLAMIKLAEEHWLLHAVPYQLPGRLGAELLTSEPPDAQLLERIRLPYPAVLTFFDQITIDALASPEFAVNLVLDNPTATIDPAGRAIVGVVLAAEDDGRLKPWVQWLVVEHVVDRGWSVAALVGLWLRSQLAGAIANLAAICTWGAWRPPPPPPAQIEGAEGTRTWRRSLQRSAARKAIARGAVAGVHVLDVGPAADPPHQDGDPDREPASTGRHVRTHWRAGHWQNYRLATRNASGEIIGSTRGQHNVDWHYEGRWVRPTLVSASRDANPPTTVYVLHPPSAPPAD